MADSRNKRSSSGMWMAAKGRMRVNRGKAERQEAGDPLPAKEMQTRGPTGKDDPKLEVSG